MISVKFLFYFDQKEASHPCGHIYGHNLQLDKKDFYKVLEDLVVFFYFQTNPTQMQNKKVLVVLNTVKSRTFYKINLLMVFIKQAGGSNLDILRKLA